MESHPVEEALGGEVVSAESAPLAAGLLEPGRVVARRMLARRSRRTFRLLQWYARRSMAGSFHAYRLSKASVFIPPEAGPVVLASNHSSWWDTFTFLVLSQLFRDREHYAAIGVRELGRYQLFERLGFLRIERGSVRTAANFLGTALALLERPQTVIWMAPQGRYTDARQRPARFQSGIGHLAEHMTRGVIQPMALEYGFWSQRKPEVLVRFGEPLPVADGRRRGAREWTALIQKRQEATQDALAREATDRERKPFHVVFWGRSSWAERALALILRRSLRPAQGAILDGTAHWPE